MRPRGPDLYDVFVRARAASDDAEREACIERELPDPRERELVHSLLRHADQGEGFLTNMVGFRNARDSGALALIGAVIGPYTVTRHLGSGGFADVYEAEQSAPMRRRVAVKVLKPYLVTPEVVARFEAERQALAHMSHPCIASVFDAGSTPDGRPYFVLELVDGEPVTAWARGTNPSREVRLDLLAKVCDAVQHAHEKGVVHRDIKSSNVLVTTVDGVPHPKVIDFGVAKALGARLADRSLVTGEGQIIGTIGSMSPEQLGPERQSVDERSDVYMLGALIFEVFAGRPLYDLSGLGIAAAIRLVAEGEPTSITLNAHLLGADVRTIVAKATAMEKDRRYASARELRMDLVRARNDEPLFAKPPNWRERTARFARRNKGVVAAVAGVFLALAAGLVASLAQASRAERAEARAMAERDAYAAVTRDTVAALQQAIANLPGALPVNKVLIDRTIASLEALSRHHGDDPRIAYELAEAYRQLGRATGSPRGANRSDREFSIEALQRAVLAAERARADPALHDRATTTLLTCLFDLGETQLVFGRPEESVRTLLAAVDVAEARLRAHPDDYLARGSLFGCGWSAVATLVSLERRDEADAVIERCVANLGESGPMVRPLGPVERGIVSNTYYIGIMLGLVGRFDEAESYFARALELCGYRGAGSRNLNALDPHASGAFRHLAIMRLRAGNPVGAVESISMAMECYDEALAARPDHRPIEHITIGVRVVASRAHCEAGDPVAAEAIAEEAVARAEAFLKLEPGADMWRRLLAAALARRAVATVARASLDPEGTDVDRALADLDRALALWEASGPPTPLDDDPFGPADAAELRARLVNREFATGGSAARPKAAHDLDIP